MIGFFYGMIIVFASLMESHSMRPTHKSFLQWGKEALFVFILLIGTSTVFGQTHIQIEIKSKKTSLPIEGVTVSLLRSTKFLKIGKTDKDGQFQTDITVSSEVKLTCVEVGFESFERSFEVVGDSMSFKIEMRPERVQEVTEVVIKATGAVDTVFQSSRLSVEDFEVLDNGNLILLTYPKRLAKGSEIQLYDGYKVLNSFAVPGRAEHLEKDFRGNVHVICKDRVFSVLPEKSNIQIAQLEKDYFYRYIAPILDTNGNELYFTDFASNYPEFSFWKYDQVDSIYDKFRTIRDDLMMELYRAEYKWVDVRTKLWAKNLEYETGIDAEIWVGANYFTQSVYYKELYSPFFKVNDELFVFDYYSEKLYRHDVSGQLKDSVDIDHHLNKKETGWKSHLLQDKANGNVYAWYEKAGTSFLGKVNLKTGEIRELYQLNFKYLEKIEVHNNAVYYVYRPFESPQKKFLYKERLPKGFTSKI